MNVSLNFEQLALNQVLTRKKQLIAIIGTDTIVRWTSPGAEHYRIDAVGSSFVDLVHPDDLATAAQAFDAEVMADDWHPSEMAEGTVLIRILTPTGYVPFETGGSWTHSEDGQRLFVLTLVDVTAQHGTNVALQVLATGSSAQESAEAVVAAAHGYGGVCGAQLVWVSGGLVQTAGDLGTDVAVIHEAWPGLAEMSEPTVLGVPPATDWCYGFPFRSGDERLGTIITWGVGQAPTLNFATSVIKPLLDLAALGVIRSRELGTLNRRATTDHVTGLLNRHAFFFALDQDVERSAVIYIDLDGFKSVNDRYGHTIGDRLLLDVAQRLSAVAGDGGRVGRLGGDEFAIACIDASEDQVTEAAEAITEALNRSTEIDGFTIPSGASVGVAYAAGPIAGILLIDHADQALLRAKAAGKGVVHMVTVSTEANSA